jgi:hypothetical protein
LFEKRKAKDLKRLCERRKRLRLPTQPPASNAEDQEDEEEHDEDFAPDGEGSRHDDGVARDDDAALAAVGDGDKGKFNPQSMRCSPASLIKLFNALPNDLKGQVVAKGFGGLLNFKPNHPKRDVSSWLMRKFNPEIMKLEIGGGKEINVRITLCGVPCRFQMLEVTRSLCLMQMPVLTGIGLAYRLLALFTTPERASR